MELGTAFSFSEFLTIQNQFSRNGTDIMNFCMRGVYWTDFAFSYFDFFYEKLGISTDEMLQKNIFMKKISLDRQILR